MNLKPNILFRQLFPRSVCIHRQNTTFVSRLLQVPQHFVKSIGITGYVGELIWFDHEAYFAGREAAEWQHIVVVFITVGEGGGSSVLSMVFEQGLSSLRTISKEYIRVVVTGDSKFCTSSVSVYTRPTLFLRNISPLIGFIN